MAGRAIPFLNRRVLLLYLFAALQGVCVAFPAYLIQIAGQQPSPLGSVRCMAISTSFSVQDGSVDMVLVHRFVHSITVTAPADFNPCLLRPERLRRIGRFMAGGAHLVGYGLVNHVINRPGYIAPVRVVAGRATGQGNRIIGMGLLEYRAPFLMTSQAQRGSLLFQEKRGVP